MNKNNPTKYKPSPRKKMERYQWEDEIILAHTFGYLTNSQVLTLLKLASAMNWYTYKGELRWSNQKACERTGLSESSLYRNIKNILKTGFLEKVERNYRAKYPNELEVIRYNASRLKTQETLKNEQNVQIDPWSL